MLTFDHLKLIDGDLLEMKKFRKFLLEAELGTVRQTITLHEDDGSCCRRERWGDTWNRIVGALKPPIPTVPINLDHTEEGIP